MAPKSPIYELWVTAQAEALAAEQELYRAKLAEASGTGPPVPMKQVSKAKQLRAQASALLNATISELQKAAKPGPLVVFDSVPRELLEQLRVAGGESPSTRLGGEGEPPPPPR